jgi:hypothetical protein
LVEWKQLPNALDHGAYSDEVDYLSEAASETMQGWGSVVGALFSALAAIAALLIYRHEKRTHRLERRDVEAAQARMVTLDVEVEQIEADNMIVVRCVCVNHSNMPIMNTHMSVANRGHLGEARPTRGRAFIAPHDEWDEIWDAGEVMWRPTSYSIELLDLEACIEFVDASGCRWKRVGQEQPKRIFT